MVFRLSPNDGNRDRKIGVAYGDLVHGELSQGWLKVFPPLPADVPLTGRFEIELVKQLGQRFGVALNQTTPQNFEIRTITDGLVKDFGNRNSMFRILPGDIILEVNGEALQNHDHFQKLVHSSMNLRLMFERRSEANESSAVATSLATAPAPVAGDGTDASVSATPPVASIPDTDAQPEETQSILNNLPTGAMPPKLVRYLPELVRGKRIVVPYGAGQYRIDNTELQSDKPRVVFRQSPKEDDRDRKFGAEYGEIVDGELSNGWLKALLPLPADEFLNGRYEIEVVPEPGQRFGLSLNRSSPQNFQIRSVTDGCLKDFNDRNPSFCVVPGDHILEVNGQALRDHSHFQELLQSSTRLRLMFER